jgi:metallothionein
MANYPKGILLTCTHEHCNCRVLIQEECHCEGVTDESIYRCVCGAELVPVKD